MDTHYGYSEEKRLTYEHVARSLASRYDIIYYVDAKTGEFMPFSTSSKYEKLEIPVEEGVSFFEAALNHLVKCVHPDEQKAARAILRKESLIRMVDLEGIFSAINRAKTDGDYFYIEMQAMWADDHKHLIIGITDVDERERSKREQEEQNKVYMDIATSLAGQYQAIYYVDADTEEYTFFAAENSLAHEVKRLPKVNGFFEVCEEYLLLFIHPYDRDKVSEVLKKEHLIHTIERDGFATATARVKIGTRYEYIRLRAVWAVDHRHLILALLNVDKQIRHEMAQEKNLRLATQKALVDELTGVKNKNAFEEYKEELQRKLECGLQKRFAFVVCDVNELKKINDTKGHHEGDLWLKKACGIITQTYCHSPVFRIGGDEFVVILQNRDYENRQELLEQIKFEVFCNQKIGDVVVAVGMSEYREDKDVEDIFKRADDAMYQDKKMLKGCV